MGKGKAYSIGKPPPIFNDKQFQKRDIVIKKALAKLHHEHGEDAWYIQIIGVKPVCQGKGYGKRMLLWMNQLADADGVTLYLECTGTRNTSMYQHCGFRLAATTLEHINGGIHAMVRPPASSTQAAGR